MKIHKTGGLNKALLIAAIFAAVLLIHLVIINLIWGQKTKDGVDTNSSHTMGNPTPENSSRLPSPLPDTKDLTPEMEKVRSYINSGKYDDAEEKLSVMLKANPADCKALTALALISEKRGSFAKAIEIYEKAHRADKTDPLPLSKLAENWMLMDNPDKSIEILEQLEKLEKPDNYKKVMKAELFLMRGADRKEKKDNRWHKDAENAEKILKPLSDFNQWEYRVALGNLHLLKGDRQKAAESYEEALSMGEISPQTRIDVLMALMLLQQELGDNEKSARYSKELVEFMDDWKPDEYSRSLYQREFGLLFENIILNRHVEPARINTHRRYYRKLYEERLQLPVVEVDQTLYILSEMADLEFEDGISGPLEEVNEFMSLAEGPPYPQCFFNKMVNRKIRYMLGYVRFGDVYYNFGQMEKAVEYYRKALELSPGNPEIKRRIEKCRNF